LIDRVLEEPLGGAHREPESIANTLKSTLIEELDALCSTDPGQNVCNAKQNGCEDLENLHWRMIELAGETD